MTLEDYIKINCIWEHNGNDTLLYAENLVGAFTRGENIGVALEKMQREIQSCYSDFFEYLEMV